MSEVLLTDMTPHPTNTRALLEPVAEKFAGQEPLFGIEQEYTFFKDGRPHGFPRERLPRAAGLLLLRCRRRRGVRPRHRRGAPRRVPRSRPRHLRHQRRGHARPVGVPGRPARPARRRPTSCGWRAGCSTASPRSSASRRRSTRSRSRATGTAPARTPTSRRRRCASAYDPIIAACEALGKKAIEHVENYGYGIEHRLTGLHETAPWNEFSYGVSDRGASVRIPWQVEVDKKGYIEDRRPNANMDPYVVTRLITDTVCSALGAKLDARQATTRLAMAAAAPRGGRWHSERRPEAAQGRRRRDRRRPVLRPARA